MYITISLVLRVMMGLGTTMHQVTFLSIVANFYPSNKEWIIGILEACAGAGMMLGPLIGTLLFSIGGYNFMMISCGVFFGVLCVLTPLMFPKFLNMYTDFEEKSSHTEEKQVETNVSYCSLLKTPDYLFPVISGGIGYLQYDYFIPILGLRLLDLNCTQEEVGLIFCICSGVYIFGSIFTANLPKGFEKKAIMMTGLLTSVIA